MFNRVKKSNNRSVMPLDVRGRTRATLNITTSVILAGDGWVTWLIITRDRDQGLQLFPVNEEFRVSASH